jgi:plastocyanin
MLSVWPAIAGDVTLHVHITRRLTKKTVAPTVYDLRGTAPLSTSADPELVSEFDRTVVMLSGKTPVPVEPQTITIEQRNNHFEPDLAVIPAGSTVRFPNSDPIFHNVFSLSRAQKFDLGFYPKGQSESVKFEHPGVVQIYCHIHANMYAAIVVTDSPWYGKPGADGTITLKGVAAGHYRAEAWHKIAGLYRVELDVPATGKVQADIWVPLDAERRN